LNRRDEVLVKNGKAYLPVGYGDKGQLELLVIE
jgi:hypothetical protein